MSPKATHQPLKVLIVGSMPPPLGGTTISLSHFIRYLDAKENVEVRVVNSSNLRGNILRSPVDMILFLLSLMYSVFRVDVVSFHGATTALPMVGALVTLLSRIARKPLIIRKFAGLDYMQLGSLRGRLAHCVASHADRYLTETMHLTSLSKSRGLKQVSWYPTNRPAQENDHKNRAISDRCLRFVYIGHVRENKGMHELVEAAEMLDENISVDIYGPLFDDLDPSMFDALKRVSYHGPIPPSEVISTLRQYDMSVLPSKAKTEGYPGIVFESYSVGLPIIASSIGAIPEIVDETSGFLVKPGDTKELFDTMDMIASNSMQFKKLQSGAHEKFKGFSSQYWADEFIQICRELTMSDTTTRSNFTRSK